MHNSADGIFMYLSMNSHFDLFVSLNNEKTQKDNYFTIKDNSSTLRAFLDLGTIVIDCASFGHFDMF